MREIIDISGIYLEGYGSVGGSNEGAGPLASSFDLIDPTDRFGEATWELSEAAIARSALGLCLGRAEVGADDVDGLFSGDLQNQCVASAVGLRRFGIPYFGLYGACSTFGEGLGLAALFLLASAGAERAAVVTSSHFCASERQFRMPMEYGGQRPPTAQWTATAGGAALLSKRPGHRKRGRTVALTGFMPGRMVDGGVADAANMGAAMAPAAADSLLRYFDLTGERVSDYDAIVTGDLGYEGGRLLRELTNMSGLELGTGYRDCGMMIYDRERQDVHSGGSGCGCSASVMSAHFFPLMEGGGALKLLFLPTGAMMNPGILKQKQNIYGIAPLVRFEGLLPGEVN